MISNKNLLVVTALLVAGAAISVCLARDPLVYGDGSGSLKPERQAHTADEMSIITSARIERKNLIVVGKNFNEGSKILIDDNPITTRHDLSQPDQILIGKKARKQFAPEQIITIKVQSADGFLSEPLSFYTGCPER